MKDLWLVFVPQEFATANHKTLWLELADKVKEDAEFLIIDISADLVVSTLKRKLYRISEAKMRIRKLKEGLFIFRPFFILRPEISNKYLNKINSLWFRKQLRKYFPGIDTRLKIFLIYGGRWLEIISSLENNSLKLYYLFDEVRRSAHNDVIDPRRMKYDEKACAEADHIFAMSKRIAEDRIKYSYKMTVLGNGAIVPHFEEIGLRLRKSVGFIGRFRNWIDFELLERLIKMRKDILFCFAGPVDRDVWGVFWALLNTHTNTAYLGEVEKEKVYEVFKMIDITIVPYKKNNFVSATRPIKIVESIFCGTPVVTVPVDGYEPNSFIKFATTAEDFSNEIDYLEDHPINKDSAEYRLFLQENSWSRKSEQILDVVNKIKSGMT